MDYRIENHIGIGQTFFECFWNEECNEKWVVENGKRTTQTNLQFKFETVAKDFEKITQNINS